MDIRSLQRPLKDAYRQAPSSSRITLIANGFQTDSNVQQARTAGGWVKAMMYVNASTAPYTIVLCFNSTLAGAAATTPPCGITFNEVRIGTWEFDFNFEVDDRFWSATLDAASESTMISVGNSGPDTLVVSTFITRLDNVIDYESANFSLIVF